MEIRHTWKSKSYSSPEFFSEFINVLLGNLRLNFPEKFPQFNRNKDSSPILYISPSRARWRHWPHRNEGVDPSRVSERPPYPPSLLLDIDHTRRSMGENLPDSKYDLIIGNVPISRSKDQSHCQSPNQTVSVASSGCTVRNDVTSPQNGESVDESRTSTLHPTLTRFFMTGFLSFHFLEKSTRDTLLKN